MDRDKSYTVDKIKKALKIGPLSRRGFEPYKVFVDNNGRVYRYAPSFERFGFFQKRDIVYTGHRVNCFEHAFFNLTNEQILVANFDDSDAKNFSFFSIFFKYCPEEKTVNSMRQFAEKVGFKTEYTTRDKHILKDDTKKVAIYFSEDDFHVYLEESHTKREQIWSAKCGFSDNVESVEHLQDQMGDYKFYTALEISPNYKVLNEKNQQDIYSPSR